MDHKNRITCWLFLISLALVACQGSTPEAAVSTALPSPGIAVIQSEPTPREPAAVEDSANSLITSIPADLVEVPAYIQGANGEELVPLEAEIVYYDIEGATEEDLRAQLDEFGPVDISGYKGDAVTEWNVSWNWPGHGSDNCDLSQAEVTYTVEVLFPRWRPPDDASNNLVIKWFNYTYRLARHEQGHVDHLVENYGIVLEAIQGATCGTADAAAQAALEPLHTFDLEYDWQTGHGATQGARFP
jgi:predicted secreted Zn-dependent protease